MYETMTYEYLLKQILSNVPTDVDKREGSIIYDAIAPCCVEFANIYIALDWILQNAFADTASREYLIRRAKERGLTPYEASKAILKASFNQDVEIGARFRYEDLYYSVTEKIDDYNYKIECETAGACGNLNYGTLIPVEYIAGLTSCEITELLIAGEDEEGTEAFRKRYFESFGALAFGGNIADYKAKTKEISGVGAVKVTPTWNGGGTVLLTIISSTYEKASDELIKIVKETLDPEENSGDGYGLAPIGHTVTVRSASEVTINISCNISFDTDYNFSKMENIITNAIDNYLIELNKTWEDEEHIIIRIAKISECITSITGVIDVTDIKINDESQNLILEENEIAKMGALSDG